MVKKDKHANKSFIKSNNKKAIKNDKSKKFKINDFQIKGKNISPFKS